MSQTHTTSYFPSIWPRSGGNRANQSRIPVSGPSEGHVLKRVSLEGLNRSEKKRRLKVAGGVVAADGSLRVAFYGVLYALTSEGEILWSRSLPEYDLKQDLSGIPDAEVSHEEYDPIPHFYHSLPCILGKNHTLILLRNSAVVFDEYGQRIKQVYVLSPDDSGYSSNLTLSGKPIFTSIWAGVLIWDENQLIDLHVRGYDIVPVAVYNDNTFAVSAYSSDGFRRIRQDGSVVWKTALRDADGQPTLNETEYAAVGSLNDKCSVIFSADGEEIGRYNRPAVFAVYEDDGWIALSKRYVARLTPSGTVLWEYPILNDNRWHKYQPIVDSQGRIYVSDESGLIALNSEGKKIWGLEFNEPPQSMFPIRAGVFGIVVGKELLFIG